MKTNTVNTDKPAEASELELPAMTCSPSFEDVSLDELSARYIREHTLDRKKGYGGETIENHFQLAILYMVTGRFSIEENKDGATVYRIPEWSPWSKKNLAEREAESLENV